ncbi:hypothetical protein ACJX0J_013921, partial [Zea mays]
MQGIATKSLGQRRVVGQAQNLGVAGIARITLLSIGTIQILCVYVSYTKNLFVSGSVMHYNVLTFFNEVNLHYYKLLNSIEAIDYESVVPTIVEGDKETSREQFDIQSRLDEKEHIHLSENLKCMEILC